MEKSTVWKINGTPIYEPAYNTKIEYDSLSAEGSGRTQDGIMHNIFMRSNICKVHIVYSAMTSAEVAEMLGMVQGKEFDLTYPDPISGVRTGRFYVGKSSGNYYTAVLYGGLYRDVSFNCVEV